MQLISLNTWGSRLLEPQIEFFRRYGPTTDIFCLQEVNDNVDSSLVDPEERLNGLEEIKRVLPDHLVYFAPQAAGTGLAIFIQKDLLVETADHSPILSREEKGGKFARALQWVALKEPAVTIYNFHGVSKADKLDTPLRTKQTERVMEILRRNDRPSVVAGDFNLRPDTESLRVFERTLRNLVIESGCTTTRSRFYKQGDTLPYADYIFVSPDLIVDRFEVLGDEVSDHLPLFLDFDVN